MMRSQDTSAVDLVSAILKGEDVEGTLVNALLSRLNHGVDVRVIVPLLKSDDNRVIAGGLFIASELGRRVSPVVSEVLALRSHERDDIRAMVVDAIGEADVEAPALAIAWAVESLLDISLKVQYAASWYVKRASLLTLGKGLSSMQDRELKTALLRLLQHVANGTRAFIRDDTALDVLPRAERLLAMITAARTDDRAALSRFIQSRDPVVEEIAREMLSDSIR